MEPGPAAQGGGPPGDGILLEACYLQEGLAKHPAVLRLDKDNGAFIRIADMHLQHITMGTPPGPGEKMGAKLKAKRFRRFAQSLREIPLPELLNAHPGSAVFNTAAVRSLRIEETYDDEWHRFMEYVVFRLYTDTQKFRGVFERDWYRSATEPLARAILQNRYFYKLVNY
jgi:hypothetical protein